jgi:hypothetical protein
VSIEKASNALVATVGFYASALAELTRQKEAAERLNATMATQLRSQAVQLQLATGVAEVAQLALASNLLGIELEKKIMNALEKYDGEPSPQDEPAEQPPG